MADQHIGDILKRLRTSDRFENRTAPVDATQNRRQTSLGIPLVRTGENTFCLDMTGIQVVTGIPEFVHLLVNQAYDFGRHGTGDSLVQQAISPELTPELAHTGMALGTLYVRSQVMRELRPHKEVVFRSLRQLVGSLQSREVRSSLLGDGAKAGPSTAWMLPLGAGRDRLPFFAFMEYDQGGGGLRITLEAEDDHRLHLKRIAHRQLSELDHRVLLQDIGKLADSMVMGIHQSCQGQREFHIEEPNRQPALFEALTNGPLPDLSVLRFTWANRNMTRFLLGHREDVRDMMARTLIALGEVLILETLAARGVVELVCGEHRVYLDVSRRGGCLNMAFDQRRAVMAPDAYLSRMPALLALSDQAGTAMRNVRVVFIHHLTAETLGCIRVFDKMECAFLQGLFIRYKGITPDSFVDALLSLPENRFQFHGLHNIGEGERLSGRYVMSRQFSSLEPVASLAAHLREAHVDYTPAMRMSACHLFMRQMILARQLGQRVLLVEDGGYLAPLLTHWVNAGKTVEDVLAYGALPADAVPEEERQQPIKAWLAGRFAGGVEHTRNGYDQLRACMAACGSLAFPSYTMAISDYKNREEGRGAAMSILAACEVIMNSQGDSLYTRRGVVIGAAGNIGRFLLEHLAARVRPDHACGVDKCADGPLPFPVFRSFEDMPADALAETDLILGITGRAIILPGTLQQLLLYGHGQRLYLASGSTKNIEFQALLEWLQTLMKEPAPCIDGYPVELEASAIRDPLTEISHGTCLRIVFQGPAYPPGVSPQNPTKDIMLLADGMPLNFNFYGVPSEIIDRVMAQLMRMCLLCVDGTNRPADLYVLDYTVDEQGKRLTGRVLP